MTTRRNYLKSSIGILGVTTLGGCLQNEVAEVKWLESGVQRVKLDNLISLSGYIEGINRSEETETIIVEMRLIKKDNTILSEWVYGSANDIPAGRKFNISANFELSGASFFTSNNDLIEVKDSVDVIFTRSEGLGDEITKSDPIKKIVDGEVKYYRKPSTQTKDTNSSNSYYQNDSY